MIDTKKTKKRALNTGRNNVLTESSSDLPITNEVQNPIKEKVHGHYQGIWTLIGEFGMFQGTKSMHFSSGRLILLSEGNRYKAIYCYSVSKEYEDQARVTSICEGVANIEMDASNTEQLVLTCNIIARTAIKKLHNSSKHFRMILYPSFDENNQVIEMSANFNTKNSVGKLVFKRG